MSIERKIKQRKQRRELRVRGRRTYNKSLPRVAVFRSLKYIYAQLIDDNKHATLASSSSFECKDVKGGKKAVSHAVGVKLAEKAKTLGIEKVVFDRGSFLYHGRVKALADGLREGKLEV